VRVVRKVSPGAETIEQVQNVDILLNGCLIMFSRVESKIITVFPVLN
jgi:hypothetical protein